MNRCGQVLRLEDGTVADCGLPQGNGQTHESISSTGPMISWSDAPPLDGVGARFRVPGEIDPDDMVATHPASDHPPELRRPPPEILYGGGM
ncbi:MAG: hypothetical protein M3N52_09150 [Actinomycetota bacterium]|nr:hypothetical protein [Actinomycetota bacterium]